MKIKRIVASTALVFSTFFLAMINVDAAKNCGNGDPWYFGSTSTITKYRDKETSTFSYQAQTGQTSGENGYDWHCQYYGSDLSFKLSIRPCDRGGWGLYGIKAKRANGKSGELVIRDIWHAEAVTESTTYSGNWGDDNIGEKEDSTMDSYKAVEALYQKLGCPTYARVSQKNANQSFALFTNPGREIEGKVTSFRKENNWAEGYVVNQNYHLAIVSLAGTVKENVEKEIKEVYGELAKIKYTGFRISDVSSGFFAQTFETYPNALSGKYNTSTIAGMSETAATSLLYTVESELSVTRPNQTAIDEAAKIQIRNAKDNEQYVFDLGHLYPLEGYRDAGYFINSKKNAGDLKNEIVGKINTASDTLKDSVKSSIDKAYEALEPFRYTTGDKKDTKYIKFAGELTRLQTEIKEETEAAKAILEDLAKLNYASLKSQIDANQKVADNMLEEADAILRRLDTITSGFSFNRLDYKGEDASCKNILGQLMDFIDGAYFMIMIAAVILVIVLSMIEFVKAVASSDADSLKKAWNRFIKRIVVTIIVILIPVIVTFMLRTFGVDGIDDTNPTCANEIHNVT